jgi:hypothetical protein
MPEKTFCCPFMNMPKAIIRKTPATTGAALYRVQPTFGDLTQKTVFFYIDTTAEL